MNSQGRVDGKDKEEVAGWDSEGITAKDAFNRLSDTERYFAYRFWAKTLEEKRLLAKADEEAERRAKIHEDKQNVTLRDYWEQSYKSMSSGKLSQRTKEYAAGTLRRLMRHAQG